MYEILNFFLLQSLALLAVCIILPGLKIDGILGIFLLVIALAVLNASIWDSALFHALPKSFSLHSATLVLINGALFWLLVKILPGIRIEGAFSALVAPLFYSALSIIIQTWLEGVDVIGVLLSGLDGLSGLRDQLLGGAKDTLNPLN